MLEMLYVLAVAVETGLGIWMFGQVFPRRDTLEKKHVFSEWAMFSLIMVGGFTFPRHFYGIDRFEWYLPVWIGIYFVTIFVYIICKCKGSSWGKETDGVIGFLFFTMVIWLTCQYWTSYFSGVSTYIGNGLPVFFLFAFYQCTFIQAYLWECFYLINLGLLKLFYVVYTGMFDGRRFENFIYPPRPHFYSEVIFLFAVYGMLIALMKFIPVKSMLNEMLNKHKKALTVVTVGEMILVTLLLILGVGEINKKIFTRALFLLMVVTISSFVVLARFYGRLLDAEKNLLDVRNEAVERHYWELRQSYEKYRCLVHDEKHLIAYVQQCLEYGETTEAMKFLDNYQHEMVNQGRQSWTGIPTLDFTLNMKKEKMDKLLVDFSLECRIGQIPMENADFIVMLENLFDNSIDAVAKCEIEARKIELSILSVNEMFILKLKNASISKPKTQNGRFITDKEEKNRHGWGLESVKRIVDKYGGHLMFRYDDTFFEASVMINE